MSIKTRTVAAFIILGVLVGSIATFLVFDLLDRSIFQSNLSPNPPISQGDDRHDQGDRSSSRPQLQHFTNQQLKKLETAYELALGTYYEKVEANQLIDGAIQGMMSSLQDPYTVYMDAEEANQFNESIIESSFSGIGAEVTMNDGKVTVVAPIKGSPAEKSGIRAKDVIVSVNGESLDGLSLNEAVLKIRGPKGSQAKLEIIRVDSNQSVEIIVVRDDIDIETIYAEMLPNHIGKIEMRQVAMNSATRFKEELAELEANGMTSLIIDVRNDPGGILHIVIELLHPLIAEGKTIVQIEDRNGNRQKEVSIGPGKSYPIVVLTNNGSASAAEIVASALQESANATLIGETTFGKGLVQSTFDSGIGDGSSIKMTIAKWLTPDGNFIHGDGVLPDIEVGLPDYFQATPIVKDRTLKLDDLGQEVRNLQLVLKGIDLHPGRSDGYFDAGTQAAVSAFQREHDLPESGEVDEQTAVQLELELLEKMMDPLNDTQLQKAIDYLNGLNGTK